MTPTSVFCLALLIGCMSASDDRPPRYLALGDSYTIGEGVAPEARWPAQLTARLRASGAVVDDPEVIAVTGWTTDELEAGIDTASPEGPYALVTLLIGVNNQYRGQSVEGYRGEFQALLSRAIAFAGGDAQRVVVVSIPDWGLTAYARGRDAAQIAREIDAYNTTARDEAEAAGARWVDITPLSRSQGTLTVDDQLHPNGEAYSAWTDRILPAAHIALTRGADA